MTQKAGESSRAEWLPAADGSRQSCVGTGCRLKHDRPGRAARVGESGRERARVGRMQGIELRKPSPYLTNPRGGGGGGGGLGVCVCVCVCVGWG